MAITFSHNDEAARRYAWEQVEKSAARALFDGVDPVRVNAKREESWRNLFEQHGEFPPAMPLPAQQLLSLMQKMEMEKLKKEIQEQEVQMRRKQEMESSALMCSVTDAINLWTVRWGDGWVSEEEVHKASADDGAMKWNTIRNRLVGLNKMEAYNNFVRIVT